MKQEPPKRVSLFTHCCAGLPVQVKSAAHHPHFLSSGAFGPVEYYPPYMLFSCSPMYTAL